MAGLAHADDAERYANCLRLAREIPNLGLRQAQEWRGEGGGNPALHCIARAWAALGRHEDAALALESLSDQVERPDLRAEAIGQAAQAWLDAGNLGRARERLDAALVLNPDGVELLIDRGLLAAGDGRMGEAVGYLDRALAKAPRRDDALVLRAAARRALGDLAAARADAEAAIALNPRNAEAWLERGVLRHLQGDAEGAAEDWRRAMAEAPGSDTARAAETNLAGSAKR